MGGYLDTSGLHVAGGQLQNGAGQTVQLHGVNRSSWEYTCLDGSGNTHDGNADQSEVEAMLAWRINAVRVVLNEDCWLGINGVTVSGAAYRTAVADYVAVLSRNNVAPIINLHYNAPGAHKATEQEPMADRDHAYAFWLSVAATFKSNSRVLFDVYNEPHDISWKCWRDGGCVVPGSQHGEGSFVAAGMQELVYAIRGGGARNPIIVSGNNWGSDVAHWRAYEPKDPLGQLMVGWHSYGDGLSCQDPTCWNGTLKPLAAAVPIVATEIGEFDCDHGYIDKVMDFLDSVHQGYLAWGWGPYDCAGDPALITDWNAGPTQTYGQGFHDHLAAMPQPPAKPTPCPTLPPPPCRWTQAVAGSGAGGISACGQVGAGRATPLPQSQAEPTADRVRALVCPVICRAKTRSTCAAE